MPRQKSMKERFNFQPTTPEEVAAKIAENPPSSTGYVRLPFEKISIRDITGGKQSRGKIEQPTADTVEDLIDILSLDDLPSQDIAQAILLAFVARCPGQAKAFSDEWRTRLCALTGINDNQWFQAAAVGETLAKWRFIKTPFVDQKNKHHLRDDLKHLYEK
jgi:hypothetical protein